MNTWTTAPLGDLCKLVNGRAFKPTDWTKTGLPIVRIQNLNDSTKPFNRFSHPVSPRHQIDTGNILLSWSGTPGTSFGCFTWVRGPAILNQHIFLVHVDTERMLEEFFVYAVNSRLSEMIRLAHGGVGLRHITKGKLESIHLPVPPRIEQRRIVGILDGCMNRIDEIRTLRAQALVQAKSLLPSILNDIDNQSGWPRVSVNTVLIDSRNGRSLRTSSNGANGRILTLSAVHGVDLDVDAVKAVRLDQNLATKYQVHTKDVFVSRSNTRDLVGLSSIAAGPVPPNTIYPDLLIKVQPDTSKVIPRFLAFILRCPSVRRQIQDRATGTSQSMLKISGRRLREVMIPLPLPEEQRRVLATLDEALKVSNQVLRGLQASVVEPVREAVLRRAFAGDL